MALVCGPSLLGERALLRVPSFVWGPGPASKAGLGGFPVFMTSSLRPFSRKKHLSDGRLARQIGRLAKILLYLWRISTGARVRSKGNTWICHSSGTEVGK